MSKKQIETAEAKPPSCTVLLDGIPSELKSRAQWVLWEYRRRKGRWTKVPIQPGGKEAKADDPRTWSDYLAVTNYVRPDGSLRRYDGIGFEFSADDPFTGVDLDDAIDSDAKKIKPWAQELVDKLSSYCELSPSGTGLKIWVKARKPSNDRSRAKHEDGEIELYDSGRYFAMTGQRWPGRPEMIAERQSEVDALYHQLFGKKAQRPKGEIRPLADDHERIRKAQESQAGAKFSRLFAGDTSDYNGDQSRADAGFCVMLAFWTNRDAAQMDRIFRSSGLMRPKWDERRGDSTYGQRTIAKACASCQETYGGHGPRVRRRWAPSKNGSSFSDGGHSGNGETGSQRKPSIILDTDEYRVNNEAIAVLSDPVAAPEVFQRGNTLARVLRTTKPGKQSRLDRPEGTPRITAMPSASLCELLTRVADFFKKKETRAGEILVPAHPPERTIAALLARGHYPDIRGLEAVIEAPMLRPAGTILDAPGWDAETGLLYEPNADFPPIPQTPSRVEAMIAADRLLELIRDFAFARETKEDWFNHRAAWLSGLLYFTRPRLAHLQMSGS